MLQHILIPVKKTTASLVLLCFFVINLSAQDDTLSNPDKAFAQAKDLAFSGRRQQGRELALRILSKYPLYTEVRTFVGRTYAWDGNYAEARKAFADAGADDVDKLSGDEMRCGNLNADFQHSVLGDAELGQARLRLDFGLGEMAALRLRAVLRL